VDANKIQELSKHLEKSMLEGLKAIPELMKIVQEEVKQGNGVKEMEDKIVPEMESIKERLEKVKQRYADFSRNADPNS